MKNKFIFLFTVVLLCSLSVYGQTVDTVSVYSSKMGRTIKNLVVLPADYNHLSERRYPVIYSLHGHGGNYKQWLEHTKTSLPQDASMWGVIIVCPDGQNSWYWDSPIDPKMQFETYVSQELIAYIDAHYNTFASPNGRAITGFSMGGHGGLWLGIRHPDVFGACGSMSGGVDIRPFPNNWDMARSLGSYDDNKAVWDAHTVATQLDKIHPNTLSIIIDCGVDDFFFEVNENLHKEMVAKKIAHDYIIRPGRHEHGYWSNALDYQLLFFKKFFIRNSIPRHETYLTR